MCIPAATGLQSPIFDCCIAVEQAVCSCLQLLLGKLPRAGVLQQHRLGQYSAVVEAVRSGSVGALNQALATNQRRFIMEVLHS